jgi:hypothetical protein
MSRKLNNSSFSNYIAVSKPDLSALLTGKVAHDQREGQARAAYGQDRGGAKRQLRAGNLFFIFQPIVLQ